MYAAFFACVCAVPDFALLIATAGLCLILFELNRPGLVLPGCFGLLLALFGAACLMEHPLRSQAVLVLGVSVALLALNLYRALPVFLLALCSVGLIGSFRFLLASATEASPIHTAVAAGCGGLLGILAAFLSRVAFRARRAKAIH